MTGRPAAGLVVELWSGSEPPAFVARGTTNADGRLDGPLVEGAALRAGVYELRFQAGAYFGAREGLPFLDVVPVRFGIADPAASHHVPLLLSPYGYSTYRGS